MTALFRAEQLSVDYGGVHALVDVDLELDAGQLVGLIGPNGAGKTSFIDAATGFAAASGKIVLNGQDINQLAPDARARAGLARTWQSGELFDDLTVRENLIVAGGRPSLWQVLRELVTGHPTESAAVERALVSLGLQELVDLRPGDLTQGQRKLVGVARALAAEPTVICLDEPAAGLDTHESERLGVQLRGIVERGLALLLVDHDMGLVLSVCDQVVVVDFGRVIARGTPAEVRADPNVVRAYLGGAAAEVMAEMG